MKARVKDRFRGKVIHGTTDHWTSRDNRAFESLCFHWIENFELVSLNVECKEFIGSTKSEKLVENYVKRLADWNITGKPDKQNHYICRKNTILATCTTDTESKMNKFGMQLESEYFVTAIYCTDHVIQATAVIAYSSHIFSDDDTTDGFGKGLVGKCRKLVQFFTTSSQRQQDLPDVQSLTPGSSRFTALCSTRTASRNFVLFSVRFSEQPGGGPRKGVETNFAVPVGRQPHRFIPFLSAGQRAFAKIAQESASWPAAPRSFLW